MRRYTPAEVGWLRDHYREGTVSDTLDAFEREFGRRPSEQSVMSKACALGLRKESTERRVEWTDERVEWFKAFVPGHTEQEISAEHERVFGVPLTKAQVKNAKVRFGIRSGTHGGWFRKGMEPANKGKTWDEYMSPEAQERSRATQFKPGDMPHNGHQPIGSESVNAKDGYVYVKTAERKADPRSARDNWKPKHHLVYERAHGPIPRGCNVVFADHDKRNFDPSNLVAVPRDLWAAISRQGMEYRDAESLRLCVNIARAGQAVRRAECRPRPCRSCGAEFEPRYPNQRRCDNCLGR